MEGGSIKKRSRGMSTKYAIFDDLSTELKLIIFEWLYIIDPEKLPIFRPMSRQLNDLVTPIRYRLFKLKRDNLWDPFPRLNPVEAKVISDARKYTKHAVIDKMVWPDFPNILPKYPSIETMHIVCHTDNDLNWESQDGQLLPPVSELFLHVLPETSNMRVFSAPWDFSALVRLELHDVYLRLFSRNARHPYDVHLGRFSRDVRLPYFPSLETFKLVDRPPRDRRELTYPSLYNNSEWICVYLKNMPKLRELDVIQNMEDFDWYRNSRAYRMSSNLPMKTSLKTFRFRHKERSRPHLTNPDFVVSRVFGFNVPCLEELELDQYLPLELGIGHSSTQNFHNVVELQYLKRLTLNTHCVQVLEETLARSPPLKLVIPHIWDKSQARTLQEHLRLCEGMLLHSLLNMKEGCQFDVIKINVASLRVARVVHKNRVSGKERGVLLERNACQLVWRRENEAELNWEPLGDDYWDFY